MRSNPTAGPQTPFRNARPGRAAAAALAGLVLLAGCGGDDAGPGDSPSPTGDYTAFDAPRRLSLAGFEGDAQEPFVSRDGQTLFFNTGEPNKDLQYATRIDALNWQYQGAVGGGVNTTAVEGAPSLDARQRIYYITTANYDPQAGAYDTIYSGNWTGSSIVNAEPVSGLAIAEPGAVNFDVDVRADGRVLYFNDGRFSSNSFPDAADIAIADARPEGGFARRPGSAGTLAAVNTEAELEYAPAISADELELFFTRLDPDNTRFGIYRAVRASTSVAFESPQRVTGPSGFVEGPAYSPDERSIYFHKRNESNGRFEIFVMSRPGAKVYR